MSWPVGTGNKKKKRFQHQSTGMGAATFRNIVRKLSLYTSKALAGQCNIIVNGVILHKNL